MSIYVSPQLSYDRAAYKFSGTYALLLISFANDHLSSNAVVMQLERAHWRHTLAGCKTIIHQHLDMTLTLMIAGQRIGHYSAEGKLLTPLSQKQIKAVEKTLPPPRLRLTINNRTLHLLPKADISTYYRHSRLVHDPTGAPKTGERIGRFAISGRQIVGEVAGSPCVVGMDLVRRRSVLKMEEDSCMRPARLDADVIRGGTDDVLSHHCDAGSIG